MVLLVRRVGRHLVDDLAVIDHVQALLHLHRHHRGHRLDAVDIHFLQLLDKGQHGVQFALQMGNLGVSNRDPRKLRDTANGGSIDGHGKASGRIQPAI